MSPAQSLVTIALGAVTIAMGGTRVVATAGGPSRPHNGWPSAIRRPRVASPAASRLVAAMVIAALVLAVPVIATGAFADTAHTAASTPTAPYRAWHPRPSAAPGEMANVASMVGADEAWRLGFDGDGVGVALVDSGVASVHGLDVPGAVVNGPDFTGTAASHVGIDVTGHGTHLAGIIAGRPAPAQGAAGDFTGIAPAVQLVNLRAGVSDGQTDIRDVVVAVRWAIAHRREHNIKVLNLAFNTTGPSAALTRALEDAWASGITVVVSAGNEGAAATELVPPANDPNLISVAATDPGGTVGTTDDRLAGFSSRGNSIVEPSLAAPGRSIVSTTAPGSDAAGHTAARVTKGLNKGTGTSQAAAVVSGAVALLAQQRPWMTPDQIKAALLATAHPLEGRPLGSGAGLIDVSRALTLPTPTFDARRPTPDAYAGSSRGSGWGSNSWGSNSWGSNSWGSNSWGSNSWGSNSWGSNSWGSNSWGSNSWGSNSWGSNSWGSNSWGSNSWGSNSWGSNSWGSNSWGSNSWGSNSWGSNSWGSNSWGSNSWGSNSWGSNSWGSNSWGSNSWG